MVVETFQPRYFALFRTNCRPDGAGKRIELCFPIYEPDCCRQVEDGIDYDEGVFDG